MIVGAMNEDLTIADNAEHTRLLVVDDEPNLAEVGFRT